MIKEVQKSKGKDKEIGKIFCPFICFQEENCNSAFIGIHIYFREQYDWVKDSANGQVPH